MLIILAIIFFIVSLFFSAIGMGGGMFYVPILLFIKTPFHDAATISLALILVTSISALFIFSKNNLVDWKLAAVIDPPTDIMAFVGGFYSGYLSESLLKGILIAILIVAGIFMVKKDKHKILCSHKKTWWCWERKFHNRTYVVNLLIMLPITAGIGLISGMLGITGGVIKLPLMVLFCGVPMEIAIATSTVMVAVTALFGLGGHVIVGHFDWSTIFPLAVTVFIGGQIGSRLSIKSDKAKMKRIFGIVLFVIAGKFLLGLLL